MAGYADTRQMIIDTLVGRMAGTEIQPEDHQAFALQITDYVRAVELLAGNATPIGFADASTVPVQPDNGQAVYLSQVNRGTTVTFTNFIDQNGNAISVTSDSSSVTFVTLLWNGQYWSKQTTVVSASVLTAETMRVTFTQSGSTITSSDSASAIQTAYNAGKCVYAVFGNNSFPLIEIDAVNLKAIFQGVLSDGMTVNQFSVDSNSAVIKSEISKISELFQKVEGIEGKILFDSSHSYSGVGNWNIVGDFVSAGNSFLLKLDTADKAIEVTFLTTEYVTVLTINDTEWHKITVPSGITVNVMYLTYRGTTALTLGAIIKSISYISNNDENIAAINANISTIEGDIDSLEESVDSLEESVGELDTEVFGTEDEEVTETYRGGATAWSDVGISTLSLFKCDRVIPANTLVKSFTFNSVRSATGALFIIDTNNKVLYKQSFTSIIGASTISVNFITTQNCYFAIGGGSIKFNAFPSAPSSPYYSAGFYELSPYEGKNVGDILTFSNTSQNYLALDLEMLSTQYGQDSLSKKISKKQDKLVSGTNIKTINNESILGSGNIELIGKKTSATYGNDGSITTNVQNVSNTVVCPCKTVTNSGKISQIILKSELAGKVKVYVGNVDQLYLFVVRNEYEVEVSEGQQTIDVSSLNMYVKAGERVALKYNGKRHYTLISGTPEGDDSFYYAERADSLQLKVWDGSSITAIVFSFGFVVESSEIIAMEDDIKENTEDISSLRVSVTTLQSTQNILTDSQGLKYKLVVVNGVLGIRALNFKHILCVGNSYTIHPTTTDTESDYRNDFWWGHWAMAASSKNIAWTTLLQSILRTKRTDAVVTPIFGRRYETNPSVYNLTNPITFQYWNGTAWTSLSLNVETSEFSDVDAVFFFLGDNYGGDSWYTLYKAMVDKFMEWFPNASIFCGSCNGSRELNNAAIIQTATEVGATYVNMVNIGGSSKMGNYVLGDDNALHQINNSAVANHIGDYGQYLILERVCPAIGYENNVTLYNATIVGDATIKDFKYIAGAIVSVFVGDDVTSVSVVDSSSTTIDVTDKGTTTYGHIFTFTMPSSDVTITAS